jgi:hypothetical protein
MFARDHRTARRSVFLGDRAETLGGELVDYEQRHDGVTRLKLLSEPPHVGSYN